MTTGRSCWLCGRNGSTDPLDKHHCFSGANRGKSEKYGLTVCLCHSRCHVFGENAAHQCAETRQRLHEYAQRRAMSEQGWTVERFRAEFGKNYLDAEELTEDGYLCEPEGSRAEFIEHDPESGSFMVTGEELDFMALAEAWA